MFNYIFTNDFEIAATSLLPRRFQVLSLSIVCLVAGGLLAEEPARQVVAQRAQLDATVWAAEVKASAHSRTVVELWDRLRSANSQLGELAKFRIGTVRFGKQTAARSLDLGIKQIDFGPPSSQIDGDNWIRLLQQFSSQGFQLLESEWHHSAFRYEGQQPISTIDFELHVLHRRDAKQPQKDARIIVRGKLDVAWPTDKKRDEANDFQAEHVTVLEMVMLTRAGSPAFEHAFTYERRDRDVASAHPIILHDLDKNGFPEIIISRWNRVYWNDGRGKFREQSLFKEFTPLAEAGIVADITDDGAADFVAVNKLGQVILYEGNASGMFSDPPKIVSDVRLPSALSITAGDVDSDGDLDLWISQYKPAYLQGQMPTPYYDANDGEPAYLLVQEENYRFVDRTKEAGLAEKRQRRTYSSSFVDFDGDRDLDLIVVSDYAGIDIYRNKGSGDFEDVTDQLVDEKHLFGMAHAFGDFNGDALLDLYAIGMSSTTARRLDAMKLVRNDRKDISDMRTAMGFGNRVYTWTGKEFATPRFADQLARTGWSWGVTTFDYDLDGDEDTYVANGFRSGRSCEDYCSTFWRHDIYSGNSKSDPVVAAVFSDSMRSLNAGETSWNGYEHNSLIQNRESSEFSNTAWLMGVGCEFDSRAVIGNDLDGDGRPDLIVTEYAFAGQGYIMKLHVYRNVLRTPNNWLAVRLPESGGHSGLFGATAILHSGGRQQIRHLVSGDSFLSQHDNVLHFGLGQAKVVSELELRWPNGTTRKLTRPEANKYHVIVPPRPE